MISKKLLSEVFNAKVIEIYSTNESKVIHAETKDKGYIRINTYELAHKCKDWAFDRENELMSLKYDTNEWVCYIDYDCEDTNKAYFSDTEPEAIFKACEYILEQKEKYE